IAIGPDRSAFVTGYTTSGANLPPARAGAPDALTGDDFPTANAYQSKNAGGYDAFLSRLSADGSSLIYSTYIGGDQNEGRSSGSTSSLANAHFLDGAAIAVDFADRAYITGWTASTFVPGPTASASPTPVNFPTKDAAQPNPGSSPGGSFANANDAFICKFNTDASGDASLVYSTFLGGSRQDEGQGIVVDVGGNVFVTGFTQSDVPCTACLAPDGAPTVINDFPTTSGAFQRQPPGGLEAFVAKLAGGGFGIGGQSQGFVIAGKVTLTDDGSPVPGVTITLTKPDSTTSQTTTDANGVYSFSNLPPVPESPYTVTPSGAP